MDAFEATKKKKKSGGFQSMGLSYPILKGVLDKGYRVPTPIQRKVIPIALEGRDVVAMARTGSGKTAAFLVPVLQRLQTHGNVGGARALILSPTRELALQTLKFAREIGKHTNLSSVGLIGGENIETQFAALSTPGMFPDILVGTPGRVIHIIKEMRLSMNTIEVAVFDEADRLFEMGFAEQLQEIVRTLNDHRQTMLFSATLPKILVSFTQSAGLSDPEFIRLDAETKLSPDLQNVFVTVPGPDKEGLLGYLLGRHIPAGQQTVVFVATKHHVEYICAVLAHLGISAAGVYGSMDQTARTIAIAKFRKNVVSVLVVTDVAARGIDVPMLDNVINYDFPANPKLYVHRAGRAARAGRTGVAISLVAADEVPFMLDLFVYLGVDPHPAAQGEEYDPKKIVFGSFPRSFIESTMEDIAGLCKKDADVAQYRKSMINGLKLYVRTRTMASAESARRAKDLPNPAFHPIFAEAAKAAVSAVGSQKDEEARLEMLERLRTYRPKLTVFEMNHDQENLTAFEVMEQVRAKTDKTIAMFHKRKHDNEVMAKEMANETNDLEEGKAVEEEIKRERAEAEAARINGGNDGNDDGDDNSISEEPKAKRAKSASVSKEERKKQRLEEQKKFYLSAVSEGHAYEKALEIKGPADDAVLDLNPDEEEGIKRSKMVRKWDRRKKKYVMEHGGVDPNRAGSSSRSAQKRSFLDEDKGGDVIDSKGRVADGTLYNKWLKKKGKKGVTVMDRDGPISTKGRKSELRTFSQVKKAREAEARKKENIQKAHLKSRNSGTFKGRRKNK